MDEQPIHRTALPPTRRADIDAATASVIKPLLFGTVRHGLVAQRLARWSAA